MFQPKKTDTKAISNIKKKLIRNGFFLKVFFDLLLILLKIKKSNGKLRKFIIVKLNGWKEKTVMLPSKGII